MSGIHDLAALYAIDALDPEEVREFEAHLADCADCAREVHETRATAARLSAAVAEEPPPGLRGAILDRISETDQEPGAPARPSPATVSPLPMRAGRWARASNLVAAAAVIVALVAAGFAYSSHQAADEARVRADQLTSLLSASDVGTVSGTVQGGGAGTVVVSKSRDRAMFVGAELPDLPDGKVYELWTISGGATPAGTFRPSGGAAVLTLPDAALRASAVAVTVEPDGGSPQPTTKPVLSVTLPS